RPRRGRPARCRGARAHHRRRRGARLAGAPHGRAAPLGVRHRGRAPGGRRCRVCARALAGRPPARRDPHGRARGRARLRRRRARPRPRRGAAAGRRRGRRVDGARARRGRASRGDREPARRRARAHGGRARRRSAVGRGGGAGAGRDRRGARGRGAGRSGAGCGGARRRFGGDGDRARRARPLPRALRRAARPRARPRSHGARGAGRAPARAAARRPHRARRARPGACGDPAGRRPRARRGGARGRGGGGHGERPRGASRLSPGAVRPMSPDALAAAGVPDAAAVVAAAAPVAGWLAAARATEVTDGLAAAADPVGAVHGLVRLLAAADRPPQPGRVAPLLRVLGGSPRLAAVLAAEGEGWPALVETMLGVARRDVGEHAAALAAAGVAGPLGRATVDETMRELTALAEALIEAALGCIRARLLPEWNAEDLGFAVLGMGKLGGGELNYSSDIDLVYVYARDGELPGGRTVRELATRVGEEVTRALAEVTADGFCFRVDLRLRPGGGEGPVAVSQAAALSYYESWGQTWERAAWLKARAVAGDRALGGALLAELEPFVYRRYLDFGTLADLEAMKRKVDVSLRDPAARARDVKLGRGGIREVEFFVQAQQLVHAGKDARLRVRG